MLRRPTVESRAFSARFKDEIKPMEKASEAILALLIIGPPLTQGLRVFRWKTWAKCNYIGWLDPRNVRLSLA